MVSREAVWFCLGTDKAAAERGERHGKRFSRFATAL